MHAAENAGQRLNEVLREGTFNWVQRHSCLPQEGRVQTVRENELGGCGACAEGLSQKQSIHIWGEAQIWTFEMASSGIDIEAEHRTSERETSIDSKASDANRSSPLHSPQGRGLLSPAYPNAVRKLTEFLLG